MSFLSLLVRGKDSVPLRKQVTERQHQTRLSPVEKAQLVAAYEAGGRTVELAKQFGVHRNTVRRVVRSQTE